jgi:hypothetical protein
MDNDQLNAGELDRAASRKRWDGGLAWLGSPSRCGGWLCGAGGLILRRWGPRKYPHGRYPVAVGFASRPATAVAEHGGVTRDADTIYWYGVDRVSGAGTSADELGRNAQCVVTDGAGDWVGPLPNPPLAARFVQRGDGKLWGLWVYNPCGQQVAPHHFAIYTDYGTGTFGGTPLATVAYMAGCHRYAWCYAGSDWDGWALTVLAVNADSVRSLTPVRDGRGVSDVYGLNAPGVALARRRISASPAAPQVQNVAVP